MSDKSIGQSNKNPSGRNKSDRDHAYNIWLFETYGDLLPDSWGNKTKFKSYVKHHPAKLVYSPDEGWTPNPSKGKSIGHAAKSIG